MVDSSQAPPAIANLAEKKLVDLAAQSYNMKDQKEPLMEKCAEFLSRSDSSPQCLKVLWKVAETIPDKPTWTDATTKTKTIESLQVSSPFPPSLGSCRWTCESYRGAGEPHASGRLLWGFYSVQATSQRIRPAVTELRPRGTQVAVGRAIAAAF